MPEKERSENENGVGAERDAQGPAISAMYPFKQYSRVLDIWLILILVSVLVCKVEIFQREYSSMVRAWTMVAVDLRKVNFSRFTSFIYSRA